MKNYKNIVVVISNYATFVLKDTLEKYGNEGYKLVNTVMAQNVNDIPAMYCFFTKEVEDKR